MGDPVVEYLARYAAPEAGVATSLGAVDHVLVVPAHGEDAALLDGYRAAARATSARVLCLLVVNASDAAPSAVHEANAALLERVRSLVTRPRDVACARAGVFVGGVGEFDVLVVDRATAGRRLPARAGVGAARKIGADVAVALHAAGKLGAALVHTTDADAVLPPDYFTGATPRATTSAALHPYRHVPGGDSAVDEATLIHEVALRYWVLGLASASSPWAHATVGSALAFTPGAYARVRGFPRREAGEDFHLLAKLASVGTVDPLRTGPVRITSRRSARTPFGTGARVARIASGEPPCLWHPECFALLGGLLACLDAFADHRDADRFSREAGALDATGAVGEALAVLGVVPALRSAALAVRAADGLLRRAHGWMHALRTVRFVNELGRRGRAPLPWREALARAPFVQGVDPGASPEVIRSLLAVREEALGPAGLGARAPTS